MWVGGSGNFGYLAPDATGKMQYVSILDRIEPKDRAASREKMVEAARVRTALAAELHAASTVQQLLLQTFLEG